MQHVHSNEHNCSGLFSLLGNWSILETTQNLSCLQVEQMGLNHPRTFWNPSLWDEGLNQMISKSKQFSSLITHSAWANITLVHSWIRKECPGLIVTGLYSWALYLPYSTFEELHKNMSRKQSYNVPFCFYYWFGARIIAQICPRKYFDLRLIWKT